MLLNYLQWVSLLQMTTHDSSKVLQKPTGEQSSHSAGRNHNLLNKRKSGNESMFVGRSALYNNCGTPPW